MDIVTHGVMGVVIAAPFAVNHPEAAAAFMMGSVLPDADALSRVGGKRNFLKCHQTYTHSLPTDPRVPPHANPVTALPRGGSSSPG